MFGLSKKAEARCPDIHPATYTAFRGGGIMSARLLNKLAEQCNIYVFSTRQFLSVDIMATPLL